MSEKILHRAVVCYLIKDGTINLPIKKLGIGTGRRNGYGGKIRPAEGADYAAKRETYEESLVTVMTRDLEPVALLHCHNRPETGKPFTCTVRVFLAKFWTGKPEETPEMGPPQWFGTGTLPLGELMPADRIWLPRFFRDGKLLVVQASYGPRQETLEGDVLIDEVLTLPEE